MKTLCRSILLFLLFSIGSVSPFIPPKPTDDILAWTKLEVGMMYSYDMVTFLEDITANTQYFCIGVGGSADHLPPPYMFYPDKLSMENWLEAALAIGAKYAVLVAQHCSGFSMWPTDIKGETGFDYRYSVKYSPFMEGRYDIVKDFIETCKSKGIKPGIYYSLNQNFYLNVGGGKLLNTTLVPGQASVTQDEYGKIVLAQMRELWTNYGELTEIWFDGGCSVPGIQDSIADMLEELQPHAVYFGGCGKTNNVRWIGTESGEPGYPIWSNDNSCVPGSGVSNGSLFCPAESDTTPTVFDQWFWRSRAVSRTLKDLQTVYLKTVGQNTNLLLNAAPNANGLIDNSTFSLYTQFGNWIQECFNKPLIATSGKGSLIKLISPAGQPLKFNLIILEEDQSYGQSITEFSLLNPQYNGTAPIFNGTSIGNKVIIKMEQATLMHELVLIIAKSYIEPIITNFAVHFCVMSNN